MNCRRLVNLVLVGLPLLRQQLLVSALFCARDDVEEWYNEINRLSGRASAVQSEGDVAWQAGSRLLHLLKVIDDVVITVDYELTAHSHVCKSADPGVGGEYRLTIDLDPEAVSIFIENLAGSRDDVRGELSRALSDVKDSLHRIFSCLVPCLFMEPGGCNVEFDSNVVFELSREVTHIIYHLEQDILTIGD